MADSQAEVLQYEIRRLREVVERQYLELAWQQSELRSRGGKATIVKFGAGPLAKVTLTENAGLLTENRQLPQGDYWPTGNVPKNALIPNCGLSSYASGSAQVPVVGINVCGLTEEIVEQVTGMVEEQLRRTRSFRPVFLMNITRTEIFRRRGFSYEYFAVPAEKEKRLAARLTALNASRASFIKRKWGISGIINFGSQPLELDAKIPAFTAGRHAEHALSAAIEQMNRSAAENIPQSGARRA
jgi:hypothetical protein